MKRVLIIACLLISFMSVSCSKDSPEVSETPTANIESLKVVKTIEIEVLELINDYRLTKGLTILLQDEQIRTQTYNHTNYMIDNKQASHDNFLIRKNYLIAYANAERVTENVAYGFSDAQSVFNAWLNSDSHRANIEGDHTHFNITAEQDNNGKWYFTNIFIKKMND